MENRESICGFWFGAEAGQHDDAAIAQQQSKLWWSKNPQVDADIRQRFAAMTEAASAQQLNAWASSAQGALALILLTDQFPRNMYRDSAGMFATDALARQWCQAGLDSGQDQMLRPIERVFFYLPLEHSEHLPHQDQAVDLYTALRDSVAAEMTATFDGFLKFAQQHRKIIAQFGRFPHRNQLLGRASTPEEIAFLQTPGSSF